MISANNVEFSNFSSNHAMMTVNKFLQKPLVYFFHWYFLAVQLDFLIMAPGNYGVYIGLLVHSHRNQPVCLTLSRRVALILNKYSKLQSGRNL